MKKDKNTTLYAILSFLVPCIMILSNLYLLNENMFELEFLCVFLSISSIHMPCFNIFYNS
jgi:hypothetical protein